MVTAPPMAYYGGKTRLASRIAALLPEHGHYVEPFAGSLAVLLAKRPSQMETVNDLDSDLMVFWRVLRERPMELARVCALTPHSRAEHIAAYTPCLPSDEVDDLERARRSWVRISQGRTGTLRKTGWRYYIDPAGSSSSMPDYLNAYVSRMYDVAARLRSVSLECRPALEVICAYGSFDSVCLYVDPPYVGNTRHRNYRTEMAGEAAHVELLDALLRVSGPVVLSGYASDLYDSALAGWDRLEMPSATGQGGTYASRTEVLWSNRQISHPTLFDPEAVVAS